MKKFLIILPLLLLVSCGGNGDVTTPDYKGEIDSNTLRIELLEASDAAQNLRLEALEELSAKNATDISELSDSLVALGRRFDRKLFFMNLSIQYQIRSLDRKIRSNDRDISQIQGELSNINRRISSLRNNLRNLKNKVRDVESKLVSVVYPCGEENGEEVLLQTQDGLVAHVQSTGSRTINFSDSITIASYSLAGHYDRYCTRTYTGGWYNGSCNNYSYRYVPGQTIPAKTYNVGASATIQVLEEAFLTVLEDGYYSQRDGHSCSFYIQDGELNNQGPQ